LPTLSILSFRFRSRPDRWRRRVFPALRLPLEWTSFFLFIIGTPRSQHRPLQLSSPPPKLRSLFSAVFLVQVPLPCFSKRVSSYEVGPFPSAVRASTSEGSEVPCALRVPVRQNNMPEREGNPPPFSPPKKPLKTFFSPPQPLLPCIPSVLFFVLR